MRKFLVGLMIAATAVLAGCGERVEVPAAYVGKIMTDKGFKPDVIPTSKFRLDPCLPYCSDIVLLSVADMPVTEKMVLFMPKDKLNMQFDLQATLSVKPEWYNELFNRINSDLTNDGKKYIPLNTIYKTYAEQIIRAEAREFLSNYSIEEISKNLETVNANLTEKLAKSINEKTPFSVRYIGLSNLQYPKIIVEAQENAAKRTEMINQEKAQLELSKVSLERELQEQSLKRKVDVEKALAEAEVNKIIADSITPSYVQYRSLQALDAMASSQNKVFIPTKMLDTVAGQIQITK